MSKMIVQFVFNSPVLVPWSVVESLVEGKMEPGRNQDYEIKMAMVDWQERKKQGYKFRENECVVDVMNPYQKMCIRRFIREQYEHGDEKKNRLKGIECYWYMDMTLATVMELLKKMGDRERRLVPGATMMEAKVEDN